MDYFTIKAIFAHQNGEFSATWKPKDTQAGLDFENRLIDENIAKALIGKFAQKTEAGKIIAYQKKHRKKKHKDCHFLYLVCKFWQVKIWI